ncbi:MAG: dihydrofolate reductase family protein [Solirubrobacterales bacterium]|nr:dihydrofolate reductase family protein [Solirubrobacterales bacterium]
MATVVADMSVSLDGFVADPAGGVDLVFAWYGKPQPAAQPVEPIGEAAGFGLRVIVYGRRTFDQAKGWDGQHPTGAPVIVVTHEVPDGWPREGSTVSFVTDGIESAMKQAEAIAGDGVIALGSPSIIQQCLNLGIVNRIQVKVVPVLLGGGIRLFGDYAAGPVELENPTVIEGNGVTHLHYAVPERREASYGEGHS